MPWLTLWDVNKQIRLMLRASDIFWLGLWKAHTVTNYAAVIKKVWMNKAVTCKHMVLMLSCKRLPWLNCLLSRRSASAKKQADTIRSPVIIR